MVSEFVCRHMIQDKRCLWRKSGGNDFPRAPSGFWGGAAGAVAVRGERSGRRERGNSWPGAGAAPRAVVMWTRPGGSPLARSMLNAATRGQTHVSTRPSAQPREEFSFASDGASTHVPHSPTEQAAIMRSAKKVRCPQKSLRPEEITSLSASAEAYRIDRENDPHAGDTIRYY